MKYGDFLFLNAANLKFYTRYYYRGFTSYGGAFPVRGFSSVNKTFTRPLYISAHTHL